MKCKKNNTIINVRLSPKLLDLIDEATDDGYYKTTSEFIREAIREKLEKMGIYGGTRKRK